MREKTYFENLDGLRAIAAIAVMLYHITSYLPFPDTQSGDNWRYYLGFNGWGGYFGVVFFFILSGFLITYLLLEERKNNGAIRLGAFYMRRLLRIWPLYYLSLLVGFYFYPLFDQTHVETANLLYYVFFASNFDQIWNGTATLGILGVQWSVAVEEQFYLLWPLLFLIKKSWVQFGLLVFITILSEIFFLNQSEWEVGYFHFFAAIRFLSFGAIVGYLAFHKLHWISWVFERLTKPGILMIYALGLLVLFIKKTLITLNFISYFIVEIAPFLFFSFVILEQCYSKKSIIKVGRLKLLGWVGKRSYGVYLIHMMSLYFVVRSMEWFGFYDIFLAATGTIVLTLLGSHLSFVYFESYFLKLKTRFRT
ncbi:MAG: acyltransferase [Cyclobacteriaceae bacterium]